MIGVYLNNIETCQMWSQQVMPNYIVVDKLRF